MDAEVASELMAVAASYARWPLVTALVEGGVPAPTVGRTPLHLAAGAGELDVVQSLVDEGADVTARDDQFHAVPLEWARFLGQHHVVAWLESRAQR
jgi:ankyrin repeat protein